MDLGDFVGLGQIAALLDRRRAAGEEDGGAEESEQAPESCGSMSGHGSKQPVCC